MLRYWQQPKFWKDPRNWPFVLASFFRGPVHMWPERLRRLYVCTWPVAFLIRWFMFVLTGALCMFMVGVYAPFKIGYDRLSAIWKGEEY